MVKHTRNNRSKRNSKCRQKRLSRKMKGSAGILNISKQFLSNITGTPIFLPKLGLDINNLNKAAFYLHAEHANNVGYKTIFISNVSKIISEKARQIYNDEKYSPEVKIAVDSLIPYFKEKEYVIIGDVENTQKVYPDYLERNNEYIIQKKQ